MIFDAFSKTAPEDRIPFGQKLAYAVGMFVNNLQAAALPAMSVILNLGLQVDPRWVGLLAAIPRVFDAVTDPIMGYISDNTRSRWGRRRPYIFAGAIAAGVIFALMWQLPEGRSQAFYFWVFLTASLLFFGAYTVYATPFVAFGYEMTADYHERTRLHTFANIVGQIAWLMVPWFYAVMADPRLFENKVQGARFLAIVVGVIVAVMGVVPAIFCRERFGALPPVKIGEGVWGNLKDFFKSFAETFRCKPFVKLCAATFLVFNGYQLGISFSLYVMIYYVFGGSDSLAGKLQGWFGMLTSAVTLVVVIPLTGWIAEKIDKRTTFFCTIGLSLVGYALKWVGYNPAHPYWLLYAAPLTAFGTGSLFTLMGSMISDVCDYDELTSYRRREGMFGAIYWWMVKVGMALAGLLSGVLLWASGFDVTLGPAQPEQTLLLLRVFDVGIPLLTSAAAIVILSRYEITEERARQIRMELEARRGKLTL
ncbi:MAG TPA: MFS transporter [Anaerohalosphaeraceae bacterium]|nr:MFS transporter [Anaerohalosphaeraceae bacterium]HQG06892.1 MFS transporter [Anaerohalosphaeraceae bacterium]HQI08502.1 MFS transporter [Anaerohalosphaeraceae bacterium]HQJ68859.1 MFS transporter [Anaerohalosphaeraceae bacterium]